MKRASLLAIAVLVSSLSTGCIVRTRPAHHHHHAHPARHAHQHCHGHPRHPHKRHCHGHPHGPGHH